jgi:predicted nuclease of predicted toxin-antitoxin system
VRVLLDECIPRRLKRDFDGRDVTHVADIGWQGKRNGRLLASMREDGFEMLITVDRNLQFQQNIPAAGLSVLVLDARSNRLNDLRRLIPAMLAVLDSAQLGQVYRVGV